MPLLVTIPLPSAPAGSEYGWDLWSADGGKLRVHKGNGLVRDVFDARAMALLNGCIGIAHCHIVRPQRRDERGDL